VVCVAQARGLSNAQVQSLVDQTHGRTPGVLGEPRISVLELNLALDAEAGHG
jgi:K+-transporting ATPase ATPase C chain